MPNLSSMSSQHVRPKQTINEAGYQRCKLVQDLAKQLNIELLFLPTYSPNLNLIKRYWKFLKSKYLYNHYYNDFGKFCQAINECLENTPTKYKCELEKRMPLKFQLFKKQNLLAV
jgi:transposase